jgi:hypothetical protein
MFGSRKAKKQVNKLLANRPKYQIADEAFETQASARSQAYGRDRSIQMQQQDVEQNAANAASMARDVSGSTTSLLSTIAAINAGKNDTQRGLASDEAAMQQGKLQNMYAANNAVIDEKDKAWNYNVNMPYQQKLQRANEKLRRAQMITDSFSGVAIAVGGSAATSGTSEQGGSGNGEGGSGGGLFGMLGSVISDGKKKHRVEPTQYGLKELLQMQVVEYSYLNDEATHVGLIAQDLQKLVPEAVQDNGYHLSIDYNEVLPVVIRAIQEQQELIDQMKTELEQLKKEA